MYVVQFVDFSANKFVLVRYGDKVKNIVLNISPITIVLLGWGLARIWKIDAYGFKIAFPTLSRISESDQNSYTQKFFLFYYTDQQMHNIYIH